MVPLPLPDRGALRDARAGDERKLRTLHSRTAQRHMASSLAKHDEERRRAGRMRAEKEFARLLAIHANQRYL